MCLTWHILISYRFVVEVDFKVLTCSKSRKYCLFSDEEAERKCKLHRCFYCGKLQTKLPRHLSRIQSNEKLVVEAMHFPKKSKERYKKLEEIRRKGEYIRNIEAIRKNTTVCPVRQSFKNPNAELVPCKFCFGFFNARRLGKHRETCFLRGIYLSIYEIFFVISF